MNQRRSPLQTLMVAILYGVVAATIFFGAAIALSGPSQRERRDTAKNVARLVEEAQKNREVLCIAVVRNPLNDARNDPKLMELCAEVGVEP